MIVLTSLDPSHQNGLNGSRGVRVEGTTSLKSCFFSMLFNNISPFLIVYPAAKSSHPTHGYHGGRCRHYPIDGMLLLDLHNSSHHTQPHSIIVQYMKYLWLNEVPNRRGKLWTCFRQGVKKSSHWSRANHYVVLDICTITFNPRELIPLILPINCECGQL